MQHRSDIDGLRALAVAPIVLFHAHVAGFDGGYVGVDIFFVISGYLITSILAGELASGRFSFAAFYARRVRRLLPALAAMLAIVALIAPFVLLPDDLLSFAASIAATALLAANVLFWFQSGYFDVASEFKPLLHIWSLSIEEQFYLVFPLALFVLHRLKLSLKGFAWLALLISFGLSVWLVRVDPSATFYLLHTRAWEFLVGALLALGALPMPQSQAAREGMAAVGLGLILVAIFTFGKGTVFPGESALLPCIGAALLIGSGETGRPTLAARLLSLPPVAALGLISYSLYLWHWPVTVGFVYRYGAPTGLWQPAGLVAVSLMLGTLSWRFVEQPFRGFRSATPWRPLGLGLLVSAIFVGLGAGGREVARNDAAIAWFYGPDIAALGKIAEPAKSVEACIGAAVPELYRNGCLLGDKAVKPTVAVIGDSFADVLTGKISDALKVRGRSGLPFVSYGCPAILGTTRDEVIKTMPDWVAKCRSFVEASVSDIVADPTIAFVIYANNYDWYLRRLSLMNGLPLLSVDGETADGTIKVAAIERQIEATVTAIARSGKTVIFIGTSPSGRDDYSARSVMLKLMRNALPTDIALPVDDCPDITAGVGARLKAALGERFVYVDLAPLFNRPIDGKIACALTRDRRPLTTDGSHLANEVVGEIVSRIDDVIDAPR